MFNLTKLCRASRATLSRGYHSFYHVEPAIVDPTSLENRILAKAYEDVPQLGFTEAAVEKASAELGQNPSSLGAIFNFTTPSKDMAMELALYHLKYTRQRTIEENFDAAQKLPTETDKLKFYLEKRLLLNGRIINHYTEALARMVLPTNIGLSLKELHNLSDDLSFYAGDRSTDFAWYSKRFALSGAFVQSELFQLTDKTAGFSDTLQFAEDRLSEIAKAGKIYSSFEEWAFFNGVSTINLIRSQLARG